MSVFPSEMFSDELLSMSCATVSDAVMMEKLYTHEITCTLELQKICTLCPSDVLANIQIIFYTAKLPCISIQYLPVIVIPYIVCY